MGLFDKVFALAGSASTELAEDPSIRALVREYIQERGADRYRIDVKETPSGAALLALPAERLAAVLHSTLLADCNDGRKSDWYIQLRYEKLVSDLCRRSL